jgi:hypothetical protein
MIYMAVEIPGYGFVSDYVLYLAIAALILLVLFIAIWLRARKMPKRKGLTEVNEDFKKVEQMVNSDSVMDSEYSAKMETKALELEDKVAMLNRSIMDLTEKLVKTENERDDLRRRQSSKISAFKNERHEEEKRDLHDHIDSTKQKMDEYYNTTQLFHAMVDRYGEFIAKNEVKTVPDLKQMVQPNNSHVKDIVQDITKKFSDYNPKQHIRRAAELAYNRLDEIKSVPTVGTDFWLSITEMLKYKVADYEDKAIFLCSLLRGLDGDATVLMASMSDGSHRPLVLLKTAKGHILFDPNKKHPANKYQGTRNWLIKNYAVDGKQITRVLYEFNDRNYKEF